MRSATHCLAYVVALLTFALSPVLSFVVVSLLGNEFKTPVYKRTLNPEYAQKDATFEFPIFMSLVNGVDGLDALNLKFTVWDKDLIGKDFLGKKVLPVNEWFKDTAFAFDDQRNQACPIIIEIRFGIYNLFLSPMTLSSFLQAQQQYVMALCVSKSALSTILTRVSSISGTFTTRWPTAYCQ